MKTVLQGNLAGSITPLKMLSKGVSEKPLRVRGETL